MQVQFTDDQAVGSDDVSETREATREEVVAYLNQSPRNAVVVNDNAGQLIAIWRGASEKADNFYYQPLPLEEPDAEGGDLRADEAFDEAMQAFI